MEPKPILHNCPECSDKGVINTPCVLCKGSGKVEPYCECPNPGCDSFVYNYGGETAWCLACDEMIAVISTVGDAA